MEEKKGGAPAPEAGDDEQWQPPIILQQGHVEALLFSDEPDPWGP